MKIIKLFSFSLLSVFLFYQAAWAGPDIPEGRPIEIAEIPTFLENSGGFLYVIASIVAAIVIIVSGIVYMTAGSDSSRVTLAKGLFKSGIIGAIIVFAVGLIINTIKAVAENPFGFF